MERVLHPVLRFRSDFQVGVGNWEISEHIHAPKPFGHEEIENSEVCQGKKKVKRDAKNFEKLSLSVTVLRMQVQTPADRDDECVHREE